ncbi:hypothetical protein L0F63_002989 [Massospora cicadina]|nr:hypothetical protein L0F63_002989 [Massospora cicadina]
MSDPNQPFHNHVNSNQFGATHELLLFGGPGPHPPLNQNNANVPSTPIDLPRLKRPILELGHPKRGSSSFSTEGYYPYFIYAVSLLNVATLAFQLFNAFQLTGSFIQTQPFNFILGPPVEVKKRWLRAQGFGGAELKVNLKRRVRRFGLLAIGRTFCSLKLTLIVLRDYGFNLVLINQGGWFTPCMKPVDISRFIFRCPEDSNQPPLGTEAYQASLPEPCSLEKLCGLGGFGSGTPNQWYRFITPIFLHGGILHLLFNILTQLALGVQLERTYGGIRVAIIHLSAGVGGFLLGANLAPVAVTSLGASGAIFGLIACDLVDLIINWGSVVGPWCELFKVAFGILLTFLLGLLPIVDNFAHIGGFVAGLLASGLVMPSCRVGKRTHTLGFLAFLSVISGGLLCALLYLSIHGFYYGDWAKACPKCQYLNCLPVGNLCKDYLL